MIEIEKRRRPREATLNHLSICVGVGVVLAVVSLFVALSARHQSIERSPQSAAGLMTGAAVASESVPSASASGEATASGGSLISPTPGTTLTLDPGMADRQFTIGTDDQLQQLYASHGLTASAAIATFEKLDPAWQPPDSAISTYGFYTDRIDSQSFRFQDRPAWGISYHLCAESRNPNAEPGALPLCTRWVFLDAYTGRLLIGTWSP